MERGKAKLERRDTAVKGRRLMGVCALVYLFVCPFLAFRGYEHVSPVRVPILARPRLHSAQPAVCRNAVRKLM